MISSTRNCPICFKELSKDKWSKHHQDFSCRQKDHGFFVRLFNNNLLKLKIRFPKNKNEVSGNQLIIKINYDLNTTEIWEAGVPAYSEEAYNKITLPASFHSDFSDLQKLRNKVKSYILFQ